MIIRRLGVSSMALWIAVSCFSLARAQAPPPPPPTPTIWSFLGIPQGFRKVHGSLTNRRGNFPGLEQKPPLLPIAAPENLASDIPALKAAAEIKQAEDLKKQKIKAIKYLASVGCGCYDKDGKITAALIESMANDCTEEVRLEAVKAVSESAKEGCCENCGATCCCNEKIVNELAKIAYERDDNGCWVEPSERVREAAKEALRACCPNRGPLRAVEGGTIEGGGDQGMIEGTGDMMEETMDDVTPPPPPPTTETQYDPAPVDPTLPTASESHRTPTAQFTAPRSSRRGVTTRSVVSRPESHFRTAATPAVIDTHSAPQSSRRMADSSSSSVRTEIPVENIDARFAPQSSRRTATEEHTGNSSRRRYQQPTNRTVSATMPTSEIPVDAIARRISDQPARTIAHPAAQPAAAAPARLPIDTQSSPLDFLRRFPTTTVKGRVTRVDVKRGLVEVDLGPEESIHQGARLKVYHEFLTGRAFLTELRVVQSGQGKAFAVPVEPLRLAKVSRGDEIVAFK